MNEQMKQGEPMDQNGLVQQVEQQAESQSTPSGKVDVDAIIDQIQVPDELKDVFDKTILSGMRLMFDKQSHQMMLDELDKPGPLTERLSNGMISLVFMLWQQSNRTLPPQLLIPVTVVLTLRAFEFLQESGEAEATPQVLGDAMDAAIEGILQRSGVEGGMEGLAQQGQASKSAANAAASANAAPSSAMKASNNSGMSGPSGLIGALQ